MYCPGVLDLPDGKVPKGIVLIVHGDGKTNAVAGNWWYDVRNAILEAGYATYMWDKMGCGASGGDYKSIRTVDNEALEVIAAINHLKGANIQGAGVIGLWGISRAGWINPVVIDKYQDIDFWISVSGVDDDETFKYLLEENLKIEGFSDAHIKMLVKEWHASLLLSRGGASYEFYLSATPNLRENVFWNHITNGGITKEAYEAYQKVLQERSLDTETLLPLYVEHFEQMLSKIQIPVLALFGESDKTVDWKRTKALYETTLAVNNAYTVKTFKDCNHNMWQCETGGLYELQEQNRYIRCEGFLDTITHWLNALKE